MLRRLGQRSLSYLVSGITFVTNVLFCHCFVHQDVFFFGAVFRGSELKGVALVQVYNIHVCKEQS